MHRSSCIGCNSQRLEQSPNLKESQGSQPSFVTVCDKCSKQLRSIIRPSLPCVQSGKLGEELVQFRLNFRMVLGNTCKRKAAGETRCPAATPIAVEYSSALVRLARSVRLGPEGYRAWATYRSAVACACRRRHPMRKSSRTTLHSAWLHRRQPKSPARARQFDGGFCERLRFSELP